MMERLVWWQVGNSEPIKLLSKFDGARLSSLVSSDMENSLTFFFKRCSSYNGDQEGLARYMSHLDHFSKIQKQVQFQKTLVIN